MVTVIVIAAGLGVHQARNMRDHADFNKPSRVGIQRANPSKTRERMSWGFLDWASWTERVPATQFGCSSLKHRPQLSGTDMLSQ
jgi:hypothetical protein